MTRWPESAAGDADAAGTADTRATTPPDSLRALFDRASEVPADARAAWLAAQVPDDERRAALQRLLDADAASGYLDTPVGEHATRLHAGLAPPPHEIAEGMPDGALPGGLIGQTVGAFRLLRLLGQGGTAAVFLGERVGADFVQHCAIKLLRRGLYSPLELRLFQRERRVLASLQHPNIARLIDGGVTAAGIPYLAMEYIDGTSITAYASARRLDLPARLRLLLTAAEAVDAAHRVLVVHRDIKPSNLLVTADGTLKLLDFGIAKLLEDELDDGTRGFGLFTPGYAAPEQRDGGAVTTATDVYALGVLLHELLLGERPQGDAPRRPSALAARRDDLPEGVSERRLRGDLDTIVLKALHAEPERRYRNAGALAADLERHLQRRPVLAHPPSRAYLLRKFVQRHRVAVLAGAAFSVAIVAALGIALGQARAAREQARIAGLQAQRANEVRDFVVSIFDLAGSTRPLDRRPSVDDLVQAALARVRSQPLPDATRAELLLMLAKVGNATGDLPLAERLADEALSLYPADTDPRALLEARLVRIEAMRRDNRLAEAERALRPLLPALRDSDNPVTARGAMAASNVLFLNGRHDEAIAMARLAAARSERVFGADSLQAREAAFLPGLALSSVKRFAQARATLEPAIARWHAAGLPPQIELVNALEALARADSAIGDYAAAEARIREALRIIQAGHAGASGREAIALTALGMALVNQERFQEAAAALDRALSINQQLFGAQATVTGRSHLQRSALHIGLRRFEAAEQDLRRAIAIFEATGFTRVDQYPRAYFNLALVLLERGRLAEAEQANQRSLALREALYGRDHGETGPNLTVQARLSLARRQPAAALDTIDLALARLAGHEQAMNAEWLRASEQRARILRALGREREALAQLAPVLVARRAQPRATAALTGALALQAQLHEALRQPAQAREAAREALGLDADAALLAPDTLAGLRRIARAGVGD